MKIKQKLILFFFILSIIPIIVIAYLSYSSSKVISQKHHFQELDFFINAITSDILHMEKHRIKQASMLVEGFFPNQLKSSGKNEAEMLVNIQAFIDSSFNQVKVPFKNNGDEIHQLTSVDEIDVMDSKRVVVVSTNKKMLGQEISGNYLNNKHLIFSGFNENSVFGKDNLIVIHQIKDSKDGKFAGALIIKIKYDILNIIIQHHHQHNQTGEVLIGLKNGNQVGFITQLRYTKTPPVTQLGSTNALPMQEALKGWFGKEISVDYRNKEVLAKWKYIPELGWGIVGKVDTSEVFSPVYKLKNKIIIISIVLFVLGLLITFYFSKSVSNQIQQLVVAFNKKSKGEIPEDIDTNRKDEFGELALSFNEINKSTKLLSNAAEQIGKGNYDVDITVRSDKDVLGNVLTKMKENLLEFNNQHKELIKAERVIRESHKQIEGVLGSIENYLVVIDNNGLVLDASNKLDPNDPYSCENKLLYIEKGTNYIEFLKELGLHSNSLFSTVYDGLMSVLVGKEKKYYLEYPCVCSTSSEWYSILISPFGENDGVVISNKNISSRIARLETIRQSQQRLKNIVDNIAEAIFSIDKEFKIISWNKSSERVYGYTEKEALGKEMNKLFKTDFIHTNNEQIMEALNHTEIWKGEIIQTNKDGDNIFIDATYTHFENQKGVKEGYVILNRDNTQNRKYEVELTNALLEGEEIERKRIATNLHDGLGQYLSALRMHIQVIKENIDTESYDDILSLIDTGIKEYRAVSHNLIPPILKDDGYSKAIKYMCDKLTHSGIINVNFESNLAELRIDSKIEIELYRITQELINNVLKHAFAKTIKVAIHYTKSNTLSIQVSDDGKGFDVEKSKTSKKSGIGLKNIISRVYLLKGKISIVSEIGKGSIILLKLKL